MSGKPSGPDSLAEIERARVMEDLRDEIHHEFASPLGLISANLTALERSLADLSGWMAEWRATVGSGEAGASAQAIARLEARAQSEELGMAAENLLPLLRASQDRARRAISAFEAILAYTSGDGAPPTPLDPALDRALVLTRGKLKYRLQVDRTSRNAPWVMLSMQDLMHVFVVILIRVGRSAMRDASLRLVSDSSNGLAVVTFEAASRGEPPELWPGLEVSRSILSAARGQLVFEDDGRLHRYRIEIPAAGGSHG